MMLQIVVEITYLQHKPLFCKKFNNQSHYFQQHICWICDEELSDEALLLEHYESHMTIDYLKSFLSECFW